MREIAICYGGTRGGGLHDFLKFYIELVYITRCKVYAGVRDKNLELLTTSLRSNGIKNIELTSLSRFLARLFLRRKKTAMIIAPMVSFRFWPYFLIGKLLGIPCASAVHNRENFQTSGFKINRIIDRASRAIQYRFSDILIFMNKEIYSQEMVSNIKYIKKIFFIPYYRYYLHNHFDEIISRDIDFLIFGRNLSYKNADNTYNALKELENQGLIFNAFFIGEGYLYEETPCIKVKNMWVSDEAALKFHLRSKFSILNYSDVSQSGPALYALKCGVGLIASNLGFFNELSNRYTRVFIIEENELLDVLQKVIDLEYSAPVESDLIDRELSEGYNSLLKLSAILND